jgi:hypothetical protein
VGGWKQKEKETKELVHAKNLGGLITTALLKLFSQKISLRSRD